MQTWRFIIVLGSLAAGHGVICAASALSADRELEAAVEKRMTRYKRIEAAHQEFASERAKLNMQFKGVAEQLEVTKQQLVVSTQQANQINANLVRLQNQLNILSNQLVALSQSRTATAVDLQLVQNQIQMLRTDINVGNAGLTQLNVAIGTLRQRGAGLETQGATLQNALRLLMQKLDKQLYEYAELADLFGTLSKAEQEAALPEFENWVKSDAENWGARLARAMAYRKLGKLDEAQADIDVIVEADSTMTSLALALRGEMKVARGNERDGLTDLAQASKLDKKGAFPHLLRGLANCSLKKFQNAEADFKLALRADKANVQALRYLALLHGACDVASVRDGKQALDFGKKAVEAAKFTDWSCFDALAAAHAEAGEYDEAARTAREAAELTFGENRDTCLDRAKLYDERQPLRIKLR